MDLLWLWTLIGGLAAGVGGTIALQQMSKPPPTNDVKKEELKIVQKLTNTDILKEPCSKKYIESHGDGLCRELFCTMNSQNKATSQNECEEIRNILNSKAIHTLCFEVEGDERDECIRLFEKRK